MPSDDENRYENRGHRASMGHAWRIRIAHAWTGARGGGGERATQIDG